MTISRPGTTPSVPAVSAADQAAPLAQQFHEAYERLAPSFGYETRKESAVPWDQVPEQNRRLMEAVCAEVCGPLVARCEQLERERDVARLRLEILLNLTNRDIEGQYEEALREAGLGDAEGSRE